jgi:hypothetical protein
MDRMFLMELYEHDEECHMWLLIAASEWALSDCCRSYKAVPLICPSVTVGQLANKKDLMEVVKSEK